MKDGPLKSLLMRIPAVRRRVHDRRILRSFPNEWEHLFGDSRPASDAPSILFFTSFKCASIHVGRTLGLLARGAGMIPVDFEAYLYEGGGSPWLDLLKPHGESGICPVYRPKGYLYGPFRLLYGSVPVTDEHRVLLMLRDPRDVLTSLFFSTAHSHHVPPGNEYEREYLLSRRRAAQEAGIDRFILDELEVVAQRYEAYADNLLGRPNVLFVTYEQMISDHEAWLSRIITHFGFQPSESALAEIRAGAPGAQPAAEDIHSHKRQVAPGDHRRKLPPETIDRLNARLSAVLARLGYDR